MRLSLLVATLVLPLAAQTGCRNSCQEICVRMKNYAEDSCGITVPDGQLQTCLDEQRGKGSKDDRETCRQFGSMNAIEQNWTCEDLQDFFGSGGDTDASADAG